MHPVTSSPGNVDAGMGHRVLTALERLSGQLLEVTARIGRWWAGADRVEKVQVR